MAGNATIFTHCEREQKQEFDTRVMEQQTYLHGDQVPHTQSSFVHHRGYTDKGQKQHDKLIAAQLQHLHQTHLSQQTMPPTPQPTPSPRLQNARTPSVASSTHSHTSSFWQQQPAPNIPAASPVQRPFELLSLGSLHSHLALMSILHIHYATLYLAFGRIYHTFPFSVRADRSLPYLQQIIAGEAWTAMPFRELPQLVQILTEVGMRLQEASIFLTSKNRGGAEVRLRRVDLLLVEAEMRTRDLAVILDTMGTVVCQADFQGASEEPDAAAAKQILRLKWEDVLPAACFQAIRYAPLQV